MDTCRSECVPTAFDRTTAHGGEVLVASEAAEEFRGDAYAFIQDEEYVGARSARHEAATWSDIAMFPRSTAEATRGSPPGSQMPLVRAGRHRWALNS